MPGLGKEEHRLDLEAQGYLPFVFYQRPIQCKRIQMFLGFGFPVVRVKEGSPEWAAWMIKESSTITSGILNDAPGLGKTVQPLGPVCFAAMQRKTNLIASTSWPVARAASGMHCYQVS
ncbi:hypothetical protein TESG_08380 [Trichophyton tonsurans CBS 112818]|uniref:SNF2 N-terminal domain-containing protein n=1 Tax=Trichophyton tonsurans (strain CBS 112818) TaxID=647933 RepID=F2RVQ5_TRIT1|nr:hypothetical protein TESG_08380 [Trichophyton tonsurans CBS 112818]